MIRILLAVLATLSLAACGGLEAATGIPDPFGTPQPFQGTGDKKLVAGVLGERPVFVGPIAGLAPAADADLRGKIATAAGDLDVMASATTMPWQGLTLTGTASAGAVTFVLSDGTSALSTFTTQGEPALLPLLAAQQLAQAMGRLGEATPQQATAANLASAPLIHVGEVSGAPPAITAPLRRAVHDRLAEMGARMSETPAEGAYVVTGAITLVEGGNGQTQITIVWSVAAPDSQTLGSADQNNALPTEAVKKNWPETATMAGRAAAGSVGQIIARHFKPAL